MIPVYLDETSKLEDNQLKTINKILFNQYRRFEQASTPEQLSEPMVLTSGSSYSARIYDLTDKSYDGYHILSGLLSLVNVKNGEAIPLMKLSEIPVGNIGAAGADAESYADISLPGIVYFDYETKELKFERTSLTDTDVFRFSIYWNS